MSYFPAELIKKKRNGHKHTAEEIRFLIDGFSCGDIPDYQMAAWLMAVYFQDMDGEETALLTEAMLHSGRTIDFSHLPRPVVDKHSTGGVGDKTSLILAPLVAAAGVPVAMIAGRGLGHTGGTLDKLEAISGFNIRLGLNEFAKQVEIVGSAIIGQTEEICPADKKIYALRDVTATIESYPLICASIMSKKLAEGIGGLVLDVKHGSGAFMKTIEDADTLADKLMGIGTAHGKRVAAFLTSMDQPLGRFAGNALEVGECIALLKNESFLSRPPADFADTLELTLELAGYMIWLGGRTKGPEEGLELARATLASGQAWEFFETLVKIQGGDLNSIPMNQSLAKFRRDILATEDGFVSAFNTEKIGLATIALGAGRLKASDPVDPSAGVEMHRKLGEPVRKGEILYSLYTSVSDSSSAFGEAERLLVAATTISLQKPKVPALITKRKVN